MQYRPEVDGLRAIAVIPVILFHAGYQNFQGGFVGVDIFFVISGYLISSIMMKEITARPFSIIHFYERRARRILPALFFVVACSIPFSLYLHMPDDLVDFGQSLIAVATFTSNILFWQETGYFNTASEFKPLLHTWSLAVEEQYYIIFPIMLVAVWRFGTYIVGLFILSVALASFILGVWGSYNWPIGSFFLLPMRIWELLLGVLVALYLRSREDQPGNDLLCGMGLLLIVWSVCAFGKDTPVPGFYTLVPTIGASLIILFAQRGTIVGRLLSQPAMVAIGLCSYSAYLWHFPILAFLRVRAV